MSNVVDIKNLSKAFNDKIIIKDLNLKLLRNEQIALLGPSGSGKTTLLRIIAGLVKHNMGEINRYYNEIGFVFQEDRLIPWLNVLKNLQFAQKVADEDELKFLLKLVKLEGYESYFPSKLSGGMRQRVNLARAFVNKPDLVLFDEAFQGQDMQLKIDIIKMIREMRKTYSFASISITHNLSEALLFADRIVFVSNSPARVIKEFDIDIPIHMRELYNEKLFQKEKEIWLYISKLMNDIFF